MNIPIFWGQMIQWWNASDISLLYMILSPSGVFTSQTFSRRQDNALLNCIMLGEDNLSMDLLTERVKGIGLLRGITDDARGLLSLLNGGGVVWSDITVVGTCIVVFTIEPMVGVETRAVPSKIDV